jgi:hypothetical protein
VVAEGALHQVPAGAAAGPAQPDEVVAEGVAQAGQGASTVASSAGQGAVHYGPLGPVGAGALPGGINVGISIISRDEASRTASLSLGTWAPECQMSLFQMSVQQQRQLSSTLQSTILGMQERSLQYIRTFGLQHGPSGAGPSAT